MVRMYGKNNNYYFKCIELNDDKADKNVEKTHVDPFKGRQTDFGEKKQQKKSMYVKDFLVKYEIRNFIY